MEQTLRDDYTVSIATMDDAADILQLMRDVANWLKAVGENQWETVADGEDDDEIIEAITNSRVFIVRKWDKPAAAFILFPEQTNWDEWLWGKRGDSAVYLHKFALAPAEIGNGLGQKIIQWMEEYLQQNNTGMLRLDCIASNKKLNLFYKECGYTKIAVSKNFSLFEKNLLDEFYKNQRL